MISRIEMLNNLIQVKLLPNSLGYTSWVKGHESAFGTCWGDTREDAVRAMEWAIWENYGSGEVTRAL